MRVALVHDYLNQYGGAERVLEVLHEMYPQAPVFTILLNLRKLPESFKEWSIVSSFAQRLPFVRSHYEKYFFLFPMAVETFDFQMFDVVISISSAWVKGVITSTDTCHISYCLTPMRFGWSWYHPAVARQSNWFYRSGLQYLMNRIRVWDAVSANRVDCFIAISNLVKKRIEKYYRRDSDVIYPPVNCDFFNVAEDGGSGDYFLIVSRLRPYKALQIAVAAFGKLGLPLLVVGEGSARKELERVAKPNVQFLGRVSDEELLHYYQRCIALVFPTLEDFGISPLEANACGRPVIAFRGGGAAETLVEGESGAFFYPQTAQALADVVRSFDPSRFEPGKVRRNSLRFDRSVFKQRVGDLVKKKYEEHQPEIHRFGARSEGLLSDIEA